MTVKERLYNKIEKDATGCWLWQGTCYHDGYGAINISGKMKRTHRVSWELINGSIPEGMYICHHCDVRDCINPAHLFLGTQQDNVKDMIKKKRDRSSKKTQCKSGHSFNEENTYNRVYRGRKLRQCRECGRIANRKSYGKRKANG